MATLLALSVGIATFPIDLRRLEFHIAAIRLDEGEMVRVGEPHPVGLGEAGERLAQ